MTGLELLGYHQFFYKKGEIGASYEDNWSHSGDGATRRSPILVEKKKK